MLLAKVVYLDKMIESMATKKPSEISRSMIMEKNDVKSFFFIPLTLIVFNFNFPYFPRRYKLRRKYENYP